MCLWGWRSVGDIVARVLAPAAGGSPTVREGICPPSRSGYRFGRKEAVFPRMNPLIQLIGFGLLAAMGNIIGGYLITGSRAISQRLLRYLIAFGAGFMLAAVFLEVIPEVALEWNGRLITAMGLALTGYLLIQFVEH